MTDNNGLKIVLSPVHLAAVLSDKSISESETLSNRLWGGLGLAGGSWKCLELVQCASYRNRPC
ncbi:hypothetical protein [Erwinia psidii]|uniref:hypothetical protein n=1 Tax=Erwinia psidii TaxID=69224 RepID=UPI002683D1D4|nr:hypothetical protein [Erwinia psidii]